MTATRRFSKNERMSDKPQIYSDIEAAMRRADMPTAMALAREALDEGLRHPLLFQLRGAWLENENRLAEACADLEAGLSIKPGDPRMLNALGRCRAALGDYGPALTALRAALHADPGLAMAHYNEGSVWEQTGDYGLALGAYERALAIDPELSDAAARLSFIAAQQGDLARARQSAEGVLARVPHHPVATFALIAADLAESRFDEAEARARKVMTDPRTTEQARIHATAYTADALDGRGQFDDAFRLYRQAKDGLTDVFHDRPGVTTFETGRAQAQRLAHEMAPLADAAQWQAPPDNAAAQAEGLVFLVGFPRSGTQMLGRILSAHPRAVVLNDRSLLHGAAEALIHKPGGLDRLAKIDAAQADKLRGEFWTTVRGLGADARGKVLVDQSAMNLLRLPLIAKLFPQARVVFSLRDPRDVVLDCFRTVPTVSAYAYDFLTLDGTARYYDEMMRLSALYSEALPPTRLDLRHEAIAGDFDAQAKALCEFAGLSWEPDLRDFAGRPGAQGEGGSRWRDYATQLAPVLPVLEPWIAAYGYGRP
jgi:tetratricopeptide (TPR) repeat protein